MSKQKEVTISGVGGQGMILSGTLLAKAAAIHDHKKATLSSEYGVETRGTFAKSDVIVSDEEIYFPDVTEPDLVVCLHQIAYARYSGKVGEKGVLIYDSSEVTPDLAQAGKEIGVDITAEAKKAGHPATANIIVMGMISGYLDLVEPEGAEEQIREFFGAKGEKTVQMNLAAYDNGYAIGKNLGQNRE